MKVLASCEYNSKNSIFEGMLVVLDMDIKSFVDRIFTDSESITLAEKSQFGQLARSAETRLLFAKCVDDYRVNSKRVSELTFFSLAQYFSIVLLECLLAEDFRPAKIIMNMMFTYYYEQQIKTTNHNKQSSLPPPPPRSPKHSMSVSSLTNLSTRWKMITSHSNSNNSKSSSSSSISLDANDSSATTTITRYSKNELNHDDVEDDCNNKQGTIKTYLYTLLKDQQIFKSIRFWTSAFYETVIIERNNHPVFVNREQGGKLSDEKRNEEMDCSKNITFGLLGSFIHNMSLLDLSYGFCQEFLDKHSAIAGLSGEQLEMLRANMETMFSETNNTETR